jgi:hypothetical protein
MKLNYIFILLFSFSITIAQNKVDFSKFDRSGMKTSLLLTDGSPFSVLGQDLGNYGMYGFSQSYQELSNSDDLKRFKNINLIKSEMREEQLLKL